MVSCATNPPPRVCFATSAHVIEEMIQRDQVVDNQMTTRQMDDAENKTEIPSIYGTRALWKPGRESRCCAFSKDGKNFAWTTGHGFFKVSTSINGSVIRFEDFVKLEQVSSDVNVTNYDCGSNITAMEFAPDMRDIKSNHRVHKATSLLATALEKGSIKIFNIGTAEVVFILYDHTDKLTGLTFAPNRLPLIISSSYDKTLKVWDLADEGNMSLTMKAHQFPVLDCAFSPADPHTVVSVGKSRAVFVWRLHTPRKAEVTCKLQGHKNDVTSCSWSPDGALLATSSNDTTVIVWDPHTCAQVYVLAHQSTLPSVIYAGGSNGSWVNSCAFSQCGTKLATICEDDRLRIWHLWTAEDDCDDTEVEISTLRKPGMKCIFSSNGRMLAVGKDDGSVSIVQVRPRHVVSLRHICRMAARRRIPTPDLARLSLPSPMRDYLAYRRSSIV